MSKFRASFYLSCCAYSMIALHADAPGELMPEATFDFPMLEISSLPLQELAPVVVEPPAAIMAPKVEPVQKKQQPPEVKVNPFTGKIKAKNVRLRLRPDLDSRIIKELHKHELVTIVGEKGNFWAVQAPSETEAYIFRSFVLDNVVEGHHVNVRLEPSLEAPVIARLNSGDAIDNAALSAANPKWLKITAPADTHFYVAKDYVEYVGGPEVKAQMEKRHQAAEQLLEASSVLGKSEMKRDFEQVDFERVVKGYHTVIDEFAEFPELVDQAKESLASFQEHYLQKRLDQEPAKAQLAAVSVEETQPVTDKMKLWAPLEEALYVSWSAINDNKEQRDYYEEQKLLAVEIAGIVEPYTTPVKNKPGDFIVRENDLPIGYVYSTQVDLQHLVGKRVHLRVAARPNNNFAFPAYYVLAVESRE